LVISAFFACSPWFQRWFRLSFLLVRSDWIQVWTEVNLSGEWVHVDSCEGVVGENSMYEAGWGKKLSYVLAFTTQHVTDVTPSYTCQWHDGDFQARRRAVTSSEDAGNAILKQINQQMAVGLPAKERELVDLQAKVERKVLTEHMMKRSWDHVYKQGRMSGSHAWKVSRNETGDGKDRDDSSNSSATVKFHIEPFYPARSNFEVHIRPREREIVVNGTSCAVGLKDAVSVVVLDEAILGLVLQSQCFTSIIELSDFISSVPAGRIVAMIGDRRNSDNGDKNNNEPTAEPFIFKEFAKLGGFDTDALNHSLVYFGQMKFTPDWSRCIMETALSSDNEYVFSYSENIELAQRSLRTLKFCRPSKVFCRLPETVMPLQTQNMASFEQKDIAVRSFY
jgi:Rad4 transglutaminase-like domain